MWVRRCPQVALEIFQHISGTWGGACFQFLDYIFEMYNYDKGGWGVHGSDTGSKPNDKKCPQHVYVRLAYTKALNMLL